MTPCHPLVFQLCDHQDSKLPAQATPFHEAFQCGSVEKKSLCFMRVLHSGRLVAGWLWSIFICSSLSTVGFLRHHAWQVFPGLPACNSHVRSFALCLCYRRENDVRKGCLNSLTTLNIDCNQTYSSGDQQMCFTRAFGDCNQYILHILVLRVVLGGEIDADEDTSAEVSSMHLQA